MKTKIEFAVVSVKARRRAIDKALRDREVRIPVTLTGYLEYAWGDDDGIDQEFAMKVETAVVGDPEPTLPSA